LLQDRMYRGILLFAFFYIAVKGFTKYKNSSTRLKLFKNKKHFYRISFLQLIGTYVCTGLLANHQQ
jgi:hypothetical protein